MQVMNATFPDPTDAFPQPEAEYIFIGRDFYALSGNLPAGTSFMWGLNLKSFNKSETAVQAELLAKAFQGARSNLTRIVQLVDVDVGNEPDLYGPNTRVPGPLDSSWTLANYSATWQETPRSSTVRSASTKARPVPSSRRELSLGLSRQGGAWTGRGHHGRYLGQGRSEVYNCSIWHPPLLRRL